MLLEGDKRSLKDLINSHEQVTFLKQWITEHYCIPEGMSLVLLSNGTEMLMI